MADELTQENRQSILGIWKDLVALVRDTALLALGILLLVFPTKFNDVLVNAGFEEGSVVGFKWKAKLVESDQALKEAQANITDLAAQNEKLTKALTDVQAKSTDSIEKQRLTELEEENKKLKVASAKVEANVQATIAGNAALVEKAQTSSTTIVKWGVVYGGDTKLTSAQYEIGAIAKKFELTNTAIFFRQGSYRSVAIASNRSEAEQLLFKAKNRRSDSYIVNFGKWCPSTSQKDGYVECINPSQ